MVEGGNNVAHVLLEGVLGQQAHAYVERRESRVVHEEAGDA